MSRKKSITRRQFLRWTGASLALPLIVGRCGESSPLESQRLTLNSKRELPEPDLSGAPKDDNLINVLILADTHIIDDFYTGPEGSPLDTDSIFKTNDRLAAVRDRIESLHQTEFPIDLGVVCGDVVHNYPSDEYDFYFENVTRFDHAAQLLESFPFPMYPGWGNHDYDVGKIPRDFTNDLLKAKFNVNPYYSVMHRGWKFIHVNNFLGETMNPESPHYDRSVGSLGETQLRWLEDELKPGAPSLVFLHYPLIQMATREAGDLGLPEMLQKYQDTVQLVVSGHTHRWMNFGDMFGAVHAVAGSTRYDAHNFMLLQINKKLGSFRILNWDHLRWGTLYATPYTV